MKVLLDVPSAFLVGDEGGRFSAFQRGGCSCDLQCETFQQLRAQIRALATNMQTALDHLIKQKRQSVGRKDLSDVARRKTAGLQQLLCMRPYKIHEVFYQRIS